MKNLNLLWIAMALSLITACRKDNSISEPENEKPDKIEYVTDSASYSFDNQTFTSVNRTNRHSVLFLQSNSKVDSIVKSSYFISGDKDSIMYAHTYYIHDEDYQNQIEISFARKFPHDMSTGFFSFKPQNKLDIYPLGKNPYAVDLERENTQNGIVIKIQDKNVTIKTNGSDRFEIKPVLSKDAQKDSDFEITSITQLKSGQRVLEAKFHATFFDVNGKQVRQGSGYIRLALN